MSKKKALPIALILMILVDFLVMQFAPEVRSDATVEMTVNATTTDAYQLFYSHDGIFSTEQSVTAAYDTAGETKTLQFQIGTQPYGQYRLDFGTQAAKVEVSDLKFVCGDSEMNLPIQALVDSTQQSDIESIKEDGDKAVLQVEAGDPRLQLNMTSTDETQVDEFIQSASHGKNLLYHILVCVALDILLLGVVLAGPQFKTLVTELYQNKALIGKLAYNDFKTKYVGSYLGIIWAFIQPIITVLVYWFVFTALRSNAAGNIPFVLYLVSGLVPWFFFSDALSGGTNALIEYQYLVKKIVFKISMLPMVKLISALFVHVFFIFVAVVIGMIYGYMPGLHSIQIFYYMFCNFVFSLALVYITCSIVIFFRDTTQIINIVLQVGIWMTPIMWDISIIPKGLQFLFKLNPMYYIVTGYRDAIAYGNWVWDKFYETILFWFITAVLFGIGTLVFKRLKVHFADVL